MKKMNNKNVKYIFILFFTFMLFAYIYFYYPNIKEGLMSDFAKSFCQVNEVSGKKLNENCSKLTEKNCTSTSCCIWTSNKTCKAGNQDGLLFKKDINGNPVNIDYYYFGEKCYGEKCNDK